MLEADKYKKRNEHEFQEKLVCKQISSSKSFVSSCRYLSMPIVYMLPKQFEETYRNITGNYTEIRMKAKSKDVLFLCFSFLESLSYNRDDKN